MSEENKKKKKKEKKPYVSQQGFVEAPVLRGFTEISTLWSLVYAHGGMICGGYVRYMCSPHRIPVPASDIDIYCPDQECFNKLHNEFTNVFGLEVSHENKVSVSYKEPKNKNNKVPFWLKVGPMPQLIKPIIEGHIVATGEMEEILENFDFTIIRCGIVDKGIAIVDADFIHDETYRLLRLKNIHCPISSTHRIIKYAKKGYWCSPMQVLGLFLDWGGRDDEYREKLAIFVQKANEGRGLTQQEVDQLEAMMRID